MYFDDLGQNVLGWCKCQKTPLKNIHIKLLACASNK